MWLWGGCCRRLCIILNSKWRIKTGATWEWSYYVDPCVVYPFVLSRQLHSSPSFEIKCFGTYYGIVAETFDFKAWEVIWLVQEWSTWQLVHTYKCKNNPTISLSISSKLGSKCFCSVNNNNKKKSSAHLELCQQCEKKNSLTPAADMSAGVLLSYS